MTDTPTLTLVATTLDSPDPGALGRFYGRLLGVPVTVDEPTWVEVDLPTGAGLSFQLDEGYVRPTWPPVGTEQRMMAHLEIRVDDLAAAVAHAQECGAVQADFQPQDDVRVCLDPDGHPFCLFL